jgi:Acyl-CoA reductase (LuxC).
MYNEIFIKDFSVLGRVISEHISGKEHNDLLDRAIRSSATGNDFLTPYMQTEALKAIVRNFLKEELLREWLAGYGTRDEVGNRERKRREKQYEQGSVANDLGPADEGYKRVGIIMAGNIPLVGFHDLLCVLSVGYKAIVKLSSKDRHLTVAIVGILSDINSYWNNRIEFTEELSEDVAAIIASGRSETMEMIKENYRGTPHLLRGSRFSAAVIRGSEDAEALRKLGLDMFLYFGLGCRSVSVLLLPEGYNVERIAASLGECSEVVDIADYRAAYLYAKAQAIMEREWFIDGGFYILKEVESLPPPPAVIGVKYYSDNADIEQFIKMNEGNLQCVVNYPDRGVIVEFGEAQQPSIDQYADGVDTVEWLQFLSFCD